MLDEGKSYEEVVWPMLVGFAMAGFLSTLPLMYLLKEKVKWNAAAVASGRRQAAVGGH